MRHRRRTGPVWRPLLAAGASGEPAGLFSWQESCIASGTGAAATCMAVSARKNAFDFNEAAPAIQHIELVCGSIRKIDQAIRKKWSPVVDAQYNGFTIWMLVTRT